MPASNRNLPAVASTVLLAVRGTRKNQTKTNMPYYELEITARKTVCVKADNPEDARHTAIMECTAMEWEEGEAEVIDDYANGENPKHKEFINRYKLGGEYYETEYNEDVPPTG
jgi:hypothetical protein